MQTYDKMLEQLVILQQRVNELPIANRAKLFEQAAAEVFSIDKQERRERIILEIRNLFLQQQMNSQDSLNATRKDFYRRLAIETQQRLQHEPVITEEHPNDRERNIKICYELLFALQIAEAFRQKYGQWKISPKEVFSAKTIVNTAIDEYKGILLKEFLIQFEILCLTEKRALFRSQIVTAGDSLDYQTQKSESYSKQPFDFIFDSTKKIYKELMSSISFFSSQAMINEECLDKLPKLLSESVKKLIKGLTPKEDRTDLFKQDSDTESENDIEKDLDTALDEELGSMSRSNPLPHRDYWPIHLYRREEALDKFLSRNLKERIYLLQEAAQTVEKLGKQLVDNRWDIYGSQHIDDAALVEIGQIFSKYYKHYYENLENHKKIYPRWNCEAQKNAIDKINEIFLNATSLSEDTKKTIRSQIVLIKANEPSWHARHWLDKLLDILSFGIRPLMRRCYSNPETAKDKIQFFSAVKDFRSIDDIISREYIQV